MSREVPLYTCLIRSKQPYESEKARVELPINFYSNRIELTTQYNEILRLEHTKVTEGWFFTFDAHHVSSRSMPVELAFQGGANMMWTYGNFKNVIEYYQNVIRDNTKVLVPPTNPRDEYLLQLDAREEYIRKYSKRLNNANTVSIQIKTKSGAERYITIRKRRDGSYVVLLSKLARNEITDCGWISTVPNIAELHSLFSPGFNFSVDNEEVVYTKELNTSLRTLDMDLHTMEAQIDASDKVKAL